MTQQPKRGRGRPPKPEGALKSVTAKVTQEAHDRLERHAATLGLSLSEYVRQILEYWNEPTD